MALGFRQRWLLVLALSASGFIIFLYFHNSSQCQVECPEIKCPKCTCPSVNRKGFFGDHTRNKRPISHNKKGDNKTRGGHPGKDDIPPLGPLGEDGWILDCITWDKKWEPPALEAELHSFVINSNLGNGEDDKKRQHTFQEIYQKKDWPANDPSYKGLQVSGPGALLKNAQGVMAALHTIILKLKAHLGKSQIRLLDIPCGDLQWMSKFLVTRDDVVYTGVDIVPELISHHKQKFFQLPKVQFLQWDIVKAPLNRSFDLVLCRDMLQHLWKADAMKALQHISQTGSRFILATTFPDTSQNLEVERDALGSRKSAYNLELPPFLLEPPVCSSYDWNVEHLGLWQLPLKQKFEY